MHDAAREWVRSSLRAIHYRSVLEVGACDRNGGVRDLLRKPRTTYVGIDSQAGPGVDVVADFATYTHPQPVDLILCCEVLEHAAGWREILASAARNLAQGGALIVTCAGPGRQPHSQSGENAPPAEGEHYQNLTQQELKTTLRALFPNVVVETRGVDLRAVAATAKAPSKVRRLLAKQAMRLQMRTEVPKVLMATPAQDTTLTVYTRCAMEMLAHSIAEGLTLGYCVVQYSMLPLSRNLLAQVALEGGSTHILFIDSDMTFPPDLAVRLVRRHLPIVAANCMARRHPYYCTARTEAGVEVLTTEHSSGVEKVGRAGTGVMLIHCDVLRAMPSPWFEYEKIPGQLFPRGEDYVFCERARAVGFEIHIDHDVSKLVSHWGTFGFSPLIRGGVQTELAKIEQEEHRA